MELLLGLFVLVSLMLNAFIYGLIIYFVIKGRKNFSLFKQNLSLVKEALSISKVMVGVRK